MMSTSIPTPEPAAATPPVVEDVDEEEDFSDGDVDDDSEADMEVISQLDLRDLKFDTPNPPQYRAREVDENGQSHGVGRRKTSVARVWIQPGVGQVKVNYQDVADYFSNGERTHALRALQVSETAGMFDVWCLVHGGGKMGKLLFLFV